MTVRLRRTPRTSRPRPVFVFRFHVRNGVDRPWVYGCRPCLRLGPGRAGGRFTTWRAAYDAAHHHARHCPNREEETRP